MKVCSKCKIEKEDYLFRKGKNKDGLYSSCKVCEGLQKKDYYLKNKDKVKETHKIYSNKKESKALRKLRGNLPKNKESRKQYSTSYYLRNADKLKKYASVYKKTENGKLSTINSRKHRNIKNKIIPSTDLKLLLEKQKNTCFYCKNPLSRKHLDHFIPLSKNGEHFILNVVWTCPTCNLKKSSKLITCRKTIVRKHLLHLSIVRRTDRNRH